MTTLAMRKPHADRGIEGLLANWYALNTAEMMKEYVDLARRISKQIPQGSAVLEVAPGPGYFSVELAKLGSFAITGLDISNSMVKIATKKADEAGVRVDFKQGSAANMPLQSNNFDFLLCRAAFKNFAKPVDALQQMCRVLRPGGHGLIIDLKRNASPDEVSHAVDDMRLSWFNGIMTRLAFKTMLLKSAYTREEFEQMLSQANFSSVDIVEENIGFEISMTK